MRKVILMLVCTVAFWSCSSDDDNDIDLPQGTFDNGVFVINEGNFQAGNASVSFIGGDSIVNNIFTAVNGGQLGDTAQHLGFDNDLAFLVINGSNKIEVVNRYSFESVATINQGLNNPRYIAFENNKAYVSNWGDGTSTTDDFVAVLDLSSYAVTTTISVAEGPEDILSEDGKVYVLHPGGFGFGETVSVIDAGSDELTAEISVGDVPNSMFEEDGSLYVLCSGNPAWSPEPSLASFYRINLSNNQAEMLYGFSEDMSPNHLVEHENNYFFTSGNSIYMNVLNATTAPSSALFNIESEVGVYGIYGFNIIDDKFYVADDGGYTTNGTVFIYNMNQQLQGQFTANLLPNGFYEND